MSTLILITMIIQWVVFVAVAVLSYWLVREIKRMEQEYVRWDSFKNNTDDRSGIVLLANSQGRNKEVIKDE